MVRLQQVCAGYQGKEVLHNISLELEPGKVTVIVGPNGCGKSTLLKTLVRLTPCTSGQIKLLGKSIEEYNTTQLAQKISYLPQNRNVPDITTLRMVLHGRFPYLKYPRRYQEQDIAKAEEALRWVGMEDCKEQNVNTLSGGNQQKVYIAMALAQDTPVILMDEPTTYLDISHQIRIMSLVRKLADQGKTVIVVLHDLSMALQVADYMVLMAEGEIMQRGTPEDIYQSGKLDEIFDIHVQRAWIDDGWRYFW